MATIYIVCTTCNGTGEVTFNFEVPVTSQCPTCKGEGKITWGSYD